MTRRVTYACKNGITKRGGEDLRSFERRQLILELLREKGRCSMSELSERCSVSRRTILRDVEELSLYHPIYTCFGRFEGGVYIDKSRSSNKDVLKSTELDALYNLMRYADSEQRSVLESMIKRLSIKCRNI